MSSPKMPALRSWLRRRSRPRQLHSRYDLLRAASAEFAHSRATTDGAVMSVPPVPQAKRSPARALYDGTAVRITALA